MKDLFKSIYTTPQDYISVVSDFTHILAETKEYKDDMLNTGLIDYWIEVHVRQADYDSNNTSEERTAAIAFLADLWFLFPDKLYQREDLADQILKVLKRAARDKFRPLRITALSQSFRLLDTFSKLKNTYAPSIYKALAMSLVENHSDSTTREYIMQNFEQIFETQPTIPVGIVVEPLVNQLQISEGVSYIYNSIDFQFFVAIAKHPKLQAHQAMPLIDILAKIYLNDQAYAQSCSRPLMMLISRFINDKSIHDFLVKYLTVSLSMLLALEKGKTTKKVKIPTTMNINSKKKTHKETKEEKEINRSLKKTFIIECARKIQNLRQPTVNLQLKNLALSTNKRNNELHGSNNVGCLVLLKFYGDPAELVEKFLKEEEEREKKEAEEAKKNNQLVLADDMDPGNVSAIEGINNRSSMEIVPYEDYGNNRMSRDSKRPLVPWKKLKPKGRIGKKAMLEIERLQKTRKEKQEFNQLQEKQQKMKLAKSKRRLASELEKRKIEYGVNSMNKKNTDRKIIFKEGEVDKFKIKEKKSGLPEIELFDFEEEEQREVEAIKLYMKKYSKLWKFYFEKYANMGFSAKQIRNFDQLNAKHSTINLAEALKFLNDHDFKKSYINKEEVAAIIRLVNFKKIKRSDLSAMNYAGFLEWIIQTAIFIYTKPPEDLSHFPPVECLRTFVKALEAAQKKRKASTILFEDPDATSIGDTTLLKALNKKIKEDPNYPIPEDYKKVKEKELVYDYKVPSYIPIDENKKFAMEMLDEIIFEKMNFHFLEPIVSYKEIVKVKPVIRKKYNNDSTKNTTPRYLQSLDKHTKPKELHDEVKMSAHRKKRNEKQRHPKLGEILALEVAKFPKDQRKDTKEVAEVLEEVLKATEKGYKALPNREKYGPIGMKNQAIIDHEQKLKEEKKYQKEREARRKKRDQQIKDEIKKNAEAKKKMLEDTKEERKRKKELQKKKKEERKKKFEEAQKKREQEYQEKKQEEMEKMREKQEQEQAAEKARKEKFEKQNKEFLKKQAKKQRAEFQQMKKEKQSLIEAEKEVKELDKKFKDETKKKWEKYNEENKENVKREKEEKEKINKFLKGKAVQSVFGDYDTQLRYYYDYYCKSVNHEITRDIDKSFSTLSKKAFVKFGYETNIIPTIIPVQQHVVIFNQLVREANEEDPENGQVLNYDYFKKALVRISVYGSSLLGGQNKEVYEKKLEKDKAREEEAKKRRESVQRKFIAPLDKDKKSKDTKGDEESGSDNDSDNSPSVKKNKRQSREGHLMDRGAKPKREKVLKPNEKEEKLKNSTIIKGKLDDNLLLNKKSSSINKLYSIDEKAKVLNNLKNVKIEKDRVAQECDVDLISDKTIEALVKHIGLDLDFQEDGNPELTQDLRLKLDKTINDRKVKGKAPLKFSEKGKALPEKAEVLSDFENAISEEDNSDRESSDGETSKKKNTKKSDDSDSDDDKKSKK